MPSTLYINAWLLMTAAEAKIALALQCLMLMLERLRQENSLELMASMG